MNAGQFIQCSNCGVEFLSTFAGATTVIGSLENCPSCGCRIQSPEFLDGLNLNTARAAVMTPMYRDFGPNGCDGSVFMGQGALLYKIDDQGLRRIVNSYMRNIDRALEIIEAVYQLEIEKSQIIIGAAYISIMTAYECLTDDILHCLRRHQKNEIKKAHKLHDRRDELFKLINFNPNDHVIALRYLYAFRNCLTHNAGIVDKEFISNIEKIGSIPDILKNYKIGDPLLLKISDATSFADSLQQIAHTIFPLAQTQIRLA